MEVGDGTPDSPPKKFRGTLVDSRIITESLQQQLAGGKQSFPFPLWKAIIKSDVPIEYCYNLLIGKKISTSSFTFFEKIDNFWKMDNQNEQIHGSASFKAFNKFSHPLHSEKNWMQLVCVAKNVKNWYSRCSRSYTQKETGKREGVYIVLVDVFREYNFTPIRNLAYTFLLKTHLDKASETELEQ